MTKTTRLLISVLLVCFCSLCNAWAQVDTDTSADVVETASAQTPSTSPAQTPANAGQQQPAAHPVATTYSDAYEVRLKIHKYASFATLPLFATELALGESVYSNPDSGAKKAAHGAVGAGIVGLFAVNGVTGVWNLWESRHDENGRKLRIIHSVLMLAGSAGIVATTMTAPSTHKGLAEFDNQRTLHRDLAISSIGVSTAGYLIMLFRGK